MTPCSSSRTSDPPLRIASIARSACGRKARPAGVRTMPECVRRKSAVPSSSSRRLEPGGQRRLTDREGVRRASHVPLPGDLDEPFDLGEQHVNGPSLRLISDIDHTSWNFRLDGWHRRTVRWSPSRCHEGCAMELQDRTTATGPDVGRIAGARPCVGARSGHRRSGLAPRATDAPVQLLGRVRVPGRLPQGPRERVRTIQ